MAASSLPSWCERALPFFSLTSLRPERQSPELSLFFFPGADRSGKKRISVCVEYSGLHEFHEHTQFERVDECGFVSPDVFFHFFIFFIRK